MGFRMNGKRFGPFRFNLSAKELAEGRNPLSSISLDLGIPNLRIWSRDGTRGITSIDTPGLGSIRRNPNPKRRAPRARESRTRAQRRATIRAAAQRAADQPPPGTDAPLSHTPRNR